MIINTQIFLPFYVLGFGFSLFWGSGLHLWLPNQGADITGWPRMFLFLCPPMSVWLVILLIRWRLMVAA